MDKRPPIIIIFLLTRKEDKRRKLVLPSFYPIALAITTEANMWKAFILGLVVGSALLLISGVGASRPQRQTAEQKQRQADIEKQQREQRLYEAELPDATPVERGVVTERQHRHSQLYIGYRQLTENLSRNKSITELAASNGKVVERRISPGLVGRIGEPETPEYFLAELRRQSDAIIQGRVQKKVSQITDDDSFVFTDYDVVVKEIFKNNEVNPINVGGTITITHPGGKVLLGGVIVKAIDENFKPLPSDNDIVMFLTFILETKAYKATQYTGSFELDRDVLRPLTGVAFPVNIPRNTDSFLQTVRSVVNK